MEESYDQFFERLTHNRILPYQYEYARDPFSHVLLTVPTGLGKTDAVLVPWLYAQATGKLGAPARLILVLPRQNLTAQTAANARTRVKDAGLGLHVLELMAGQEENNEALSPNEPVIIVCTQDMYFSRALNRGYARRPPRWPIDFALYNQDCLIVLDEIQLMNEALATSTQLAAFRERFQTIGKAPCVWMSATVNLDWLNTVDFRLPLRRIQLSGKDMESKVVQERIHSLKKLAQAPETCGSPQGCAAFVLEHHRPGTRSLVIANTVPRAREIFAALRSSFPGAILLHSRFRPDDRKKASDRLLSGVPPEGQLVVSTQVLEAGIDITSRLLVTDAAPWGSLVQRFGRVNRYGKDTDSEIWWVDRPSYSKQKDPTAPYAPAEVELAIQRLRPLTSAAPADLPQEDGPAPWRHVLRRADLLDLFDTTPDLSGNELDVSRFIRATGDKDAYLAWREWDANTVLPPNELSDGELCPVPIGELREFLKKRSVYTWNYATDEWKEVDRNHKLYPGMLVLARSRDGGYTAEEGWSPESKAKVPPLEPLPREIDADGRDPQAFLSYRQILVEHTDRVVEELEVLLSRCEIDAEYAEALLTAAARHDWGKVHPVFQTTLHGSPIYDVLLAKQERGAGYAKHGRPHFRHELASALAMLQSGESDLAAYLAAAHHGKVRLGIRSMPGEREELSLRIARGIRDGDILPSCGLGSGARVPEVTLSLAPMEFGAEGGSWTARMLQLLEMIGPFRLAYMELLLRAADETASAKLRLPEDACPT